MTQTGLSRRQKRIMAQARKDALAVLDHPPSVRFLVRTLEDCGLWRDQMTASDNLTNYNLGKRKTGLDIMGQLQAVDPDAMLKMLQVAAQERSNNAPLQDEEESDED